MNEVVTLIYTFSTPDGQKKISFKYANPEATTSAVSAGAQAIITNGSIFEFPPTELVKATLRTVTEEDYDLSD